MLTAAVVPSSTPATASPGSGAAASGLSAALPSQYLSYYQQYYQTQVTAKVRRIQNLESLTPSTQPTMHYSATGFAPQTGYAAPVYSAGGYPSYAAALTQGAAANYTYPYAAPFSYAAPFAAVKPTAPLANFPQAAATPAPVVPSQPAIRVQPSPATVQPTPVGSSSADPAKKPNPQRFAAPAASNGGKQQWPPSLKAFVEKTFAQCRDEGDRTFADAELRKRIAKVAADARLSVHKWELEYITLPSEQKLNTEVPQLSTEVPQVEESVSTPKKRKSRFDMVPEEIASINEPAIGIVQEKRLKAIGELNVNEDQERLSRERRADRFSKDVAHQRKQADTNWRKKNEPVVTAPAGKGALTDEELEALMVVGTCEVPEKEYFRLTSAPDPSTVRPERVLRQALATLQEKWAKKT